MVDLRPIFFVLGIILTFFSGAMLFPITADILTGNDDWQVFTISMFVSTFIGVMMILTNRGQEFNLNIRQTFLLTNLTWVVLSIFGAVPFFLSDLQLSPTDALFESVSGITTTGSTVLTGLDSMPAGILLWRAILQWMGGIGVIVMALSVLPFLKVGGMQLFLTESSENEKAMPRAAQMAGYTAIIYSIFTFICMLAYNMAGMTAFDALCHAMTTIATGGYSTSDSSIGYFAQADIEFVAITFMIIGSLPFVLYLRALRGSITPLFKDHQVHVFLMILASAIGFMTFYLSQVQGMALFESFRFSAFNLVSITTGTGYATTDFYLWGGLPVMIFFFLMFMGGCAGSTTCGIKVFRFQVLFNVARAQLRSLTYPNGVFTPYYNGRPIPADVPTAVMSFFYVFVLSYALIALLLSATGLDYVTALSGAATALSNVGPGLGGIIGPSGTFQTLPDPAKWVLCFGMFLGRLELFTVFVLLSRKFWER